MKKLIMDDFSLLGNALALAAKKAPTLESLAAELNVRQEDLSLCWFALNNLRRCQGRVLPVPFEAVAEGPADVRSILGLGRLLADARIGHPPGDVVDVAR